MCCLSRMGGFAAVAVVLSLGGAAGAGGFVPTWSVQRLELTPAQFGIGFPLFGVELNATIYFGRAYFDLNDVSGPSGLPDGIVDTVDLLNATGSPHASSVRVSPIASENTVLSATPSHSRVQPNIWDGGVHSFSVAVVNTAEPILSSDPMLTLVVDARSQLVVQGTAFGRTGQRQSFAYTLLFGAPDSDLVFSPTSDAVVDIRQPGVHQTPVIDVSTIWNGLPSNDYPISIGTVPEVIADNLRLSGGVGAPLSVQLVDLGPQDVGVHVIPFTSDLGFGPLTRTLKVVVVPEPTTLLLFCAAGIPLRRHRIA